MEIFGVLKRHEKTPSSNVHLMTPFEDQQGFSTAQGLQKDWEVDLNCQMAMFLIFSRDNWVYP